MRKFNHIHTNKHVLSFYSFNHLIKTNSVYKTLMENLDDSIDEEFLRNILSGLKMEIDIYAYETKTTVEYINKEELRKVSAIINFFNNKYPVDGVFYEDLTGLEQSIFEDQNKFNIKSLALPFSEDDLEKFKNSIK